MDKKKIVQILTLLFYILVISTATTYFVAPRSVWFYYQGFGAVGVRLFTYIIRQIL